MLGVLASSVFFMLRDDLVNTTLARHAQMQNAYEDRISALRTKVDLVTSRQLLDQRKVEARVEELLTKQRELKRRSLSVTRAYTRTGSAPSSSVAPATSKVLKLKPGVDSSTGLRLGSLSQTWKDVDATDETTTASVSLFAPTQTNGRRVGNSTFDRLEQSLKAAEEQQLVALNRLRDKTLNTNRQLRRILKQQGVKLPTNGTSIGGPLIELKGGSQFVATEEALNAALHDLNVVRSAALSLPHGSPSPGARISSRFGSRRDPFTGRSAVHSGLDFSAPRGTPIVATAGGRVTKAGRLGGYGKLVELDHGGGITTRFAHLSRINVKLGQKVARGQLVGRVGSTGRSTGPHLHYEVRRKGRALDPLTFVRLERKLRPYL
ncbi:MAG: M23 family metallopeptidase [Pseudomonadota bacterium]